MAFSKELEEIIDAALADGMITEKERAVLHKKAMQEGVDPDEVDVVVDGRLAKMKREVDWLRPEPPRSVKHGNVAKCPSCGAPYNPGMGKCPECGHVFQNIGANHSAQRFADGIEEITSRFREKIASTSKAEKEEGLFGAMKFTGAQASAQLEMQMYRELDNYIKNFVIPSSKDDLLEFIISMDAKRGFFTGDILQNAYNVKYKEACKKARIVFPDDPQFADLFEAQNIEKKSNAKKKVVYGCLWAIGIVIFLFVGLVFG